MGQKISELTDGITAQGSDLVRVARSSGGGYIDRRLSLGDLAALLPNVTVTGGDSLRFSDFEDGTNTVGTGTPRTLSSLGYSDGSAATQFPLTASAWGGITASAVDYDTAVIQEAFLTLQGGGNKIRKLVAGTGAFILAGNEVIIPSFKSGISSNNDSQMFVFDGEGCRFRVTGSQSYAFTSSIADQTTAGNSCIDNRWRFGNFKITGTGSNTAIRFGATRSPLIEQIEIDGFATGLQAGFLLNALYMNIATVNCSSQGVLIDKGWWTSAGYSTAGNQPMFINCRFRTVGNTEIGCKVIGADSTWFQRCTAEGPDGQYGIYIDNSVTTVSKNARIDMLHAEIDSSGIYANGIIGVKGSDPFTFKATEVFWQGGSNVNLIESESTNGTNHIVLRDCLTNTNWKLKQINTGSGQSSWDMKNVTLQGNPTDAADVLDTVGFPNIWASGSDIPTSNRVRFEPPLN